MRDLHIGSLAVLEAGNLVGIVSERDIMNKVVAEDKAPDTVQVSEIMSSPVITASEKDSLEDVMQLMGEKQIRHLPLVDDQGKAIAMLSVRDILRYQFEKLDEENQSLFAYITADGPGG